MEICLTQHIIEHEILGVSASNLLTVSGLNDVNLVVPTTSGQALVWNGTDWQNAFVDHSLLINLDTDDHTIYLTSGRADTWLTAKTTSDLTEGSNLYFTNERVDDRVAALVVQGVRH